MEAHSTTPALATSDFRKERKNVAMARNRLATPSVALIAAMRRRDRTGSPGEAGRSNLVEGRKKLLDRGSCFQTGVAKAQSAWLRQRDVAFQLFAPKGYEAAGQRPPSSRSRGRTPA